MASLEVVPKKSFEKNSYEIGKGLNFDGVEFKDGEYILADLDGIVVVPKRLNGKS